MNAIFKYPLDLSVSRAIPMPYGAKILCVQNQKEKPTLWALVDPSERIFVDRIICCFPTGPAIVPPELTHLGTVLLDGGNAVFHYFEDTNATVTMPTGLSQRQEARIQH